MCGLGQTLPNPVLSTLRHFREEYEAHIRDRRCPALVCKSLIKYTIDPDLCPGCVVCLKACPAEAIRGSTKHVQCPRRNVVQPVPGSLSPKVSAVRVSGREEERSRFEPVPVAGAQATRAAKTRKVRRHDRPRSARRSRCPRTAR
jgi:ferredoxin